jgi:hypothetical protein
MLVGNFIVDARTGDVMTWPNGERLPVPDGVKQFATKLVAQAQTRVLSRQEAQCVAWLTARETGGSTAPADVERLDLTDGELRFSVRYPLVQPSANAVIYFLMDWPPFAVVTSSDRRPIHSVELDGLLSQIRTAHGEVALSPLESVEVALRVPRIVEPVSSKCPPLVFADSGTSRLRFVGVEDACEHLPRSRRLIAAVDVLTGAVTDPRDQRVLDTPESIELARELLSRAGERRAAAKEETERVCRAR